MTCWRHVRAGAADNAADIVGHKGRRQHGRDVRSAPQLGRHVALPIPHQQRWRAQRCGPQPHNVLIIILEVHPSLYLVG